MDILDGNSFSHLYDHIDAADKDADDNHRQPALKRVPSPRREMRLNSSASEGGLRDRARSKSRSRARSKSRGREPRAEKAKNCKNFNGWDQQLHASPSGDDNEKRPRLSRALSLSAGDRSAAVPALVQDDGTCGSGKSKTNSRSCVDESSSSSKENNPSASPRRRGVARTSSCRELRSGADVGLASIKDKTDSSVASFASKEDFEQLEAKTQLYKEEFQRAQKEKNKIKKEKDKEVEQLKKEIEQLRKEIRASDTENRKLKENLQNGAGSSYKLHVLEDENARLQAELKGTVERASTMLKEREAAIDELMRELELARNESIQTRTMFDATLYKNKMKMEKLDQEKDAYAQRVLELEELLNRKGKR